MMQYRLRTLLIVITAIGMALGWWLDRSSVARQRDAARLHARELRDSLWLARTGYSIVSGEDQPPARAVMWFEMANWDLVDQPLP